MPADRAVNTRRHRTGLLTRCACSSRGESKPIAASFRLQEECQVLMQEAAGAQESPTWDGCDEGKYRGAGPRIHLPGGLVHVSESQRSRCGQSTGSISPAKKTTCSSPLL